MRLNKKIVSMVLGLSASLLGGNALAVTLNGSTVSYSFNSADLGLFGSASLSGDDLVFTPTNFTASSSNGGNAHQTIHITVTAKPGYQLSAFNLTESGAYTLTSGAYVTVTGNITATNIGGTSFPNNVGNISSTTPTTVVGSNTAWIANAGVTLPTSWGGPNGIGSVDLMVTNQLYATSPIDGFSQIWKNAVGINVVTGVSPVPEAQTYAMMLAGLGLVGFMARRRSSASV
jgi:hypothetical protein